VGLLCMFLLGCLTILAVVVRSALQDLTVNNLPTCK
jgi:hypothetical protein